MFDLKQYEYLRDRCDICEQVRHEPMIVMTATCKKQVGQHVSTIRVHVHCLLEKINGK